MFRKPREVSAPVASEFSIRPSTGRPPTPPPSASQRTAQANASTTYDMAATTPLVGKTKPTQKKTPTTNASAVKARGKASGNGNGNIMSFFKRAESTETNGMYSKEEEDSLFLEASPVTIEGHMPTQTPTPPRDESLFGDVKFESAESPTSRFNEDAVPIKRRRLEEIAVQSSVPEVEPAAEVPRKGPFADDSDSDDEHAMLANSTKPPPPITPTREETEISKPTLLSEPHEGRAEQAFPAPRLKREATSVGDINDFEGIDDFIDDEFPEDGEEYMERRWMEEQGELEMGLEDEEQDTEANPTTTEDPTEPASMMSADAGSTCCPICGGSTEGMAEQVCEAIHHSRIGLTACSKFLYTSMTAWMAKQGHYLIQSSRPKNHQLLR